MQLRLANCAKEEGLLENPPRTLAFARLGTLFIDQQSIFSYTNSKIMHLVCSQALQLIHNIQNKYVSTQTH